LSVLAAILLGTIAVLLLVPSLVLFLEVMASLGRRTANTAASRRPRVAILMPAHNEAAVIATTLGSMLPQLQAGDRLLVVADNCSDDTASIATNLGAQVAIRTDTVHRGKGYALDFGMQQLQGEPPEVVIIMDADCTIDADCVDRLARECVRSGRPVQALYLMQSPAGASLKTRIAEFAWLVKNQVRPLGLLNLGLPCQLMGTGMAFPWAQLRSARLASGHIVEDLKLGLDLALAGAPALFLPDTVVRSEFPLSREGIQSQRTRWEHGHLQVILTEAPRLALTSITRFKGDLLALALDLSVPPLSLLVLLSGAVWVSTVVLYLLTAAKLPLAAASLAVSLVAIAVGISWFGYARRILSLGSLAYAAVYALWKIPVYVRFLLARQMDWVRSKRDGER
jgi:cellulose synthase/poly-beta-1,6-N-acetylglucosamine synthase-like glycosyltransferase